MRRNFASAFVGNLGSGPGQVAGLVVGICWFTPLIFTIICAFLDNIYPGMIGYGSFNDSSCWIGEESSHMMFFAIPSFVSLFLNILLLSLSLWMMISLQMSLQNIKSDIRFSSHREMAFAALRLIASVGLQWIFGFVLYIHRSVVTEILFVVTTSLQGFFVALSIITTRFMRALLKRWMAKVFLRPTVNPVNPVIATVSQRKVGGNLGIQSSQKSYLNETTSTSFCHDS